MNQNEYYVGYAVCYDWACVATTAAIARALFSMAGAAYWRGEGEDCHGHGSGDMRDMPTTWSREKGERKEKREKRKERVFESQPCRTTPKTKGANLDPAFDLTPRINIYVAVLAS